MNNQINIQNDGINIYATLSVRAAKVGLVILTIMLIGLFVMVGFFFSEVKFKHFEEFVVAVLIIVPIGGYSIKYYLWNLYGKESIIINTKSISWQYDYGFVQTNLETFKYHILGTGFEKLGQRDNGDELGRLIFYNYREEDNLPEVIHSTTILLTKEEIEILDEKIISLFAGEFLNRNGFIPFSEN